MVSGGVQKEMVPAAISSYQSGTICSSQKIQLKESVDGMFREISLMVLELSMEVVDINSSACNYFPIKNRLKKPQKQMHAMENQFKCFEQLGML